MVTGGVSPGNRSDPGAPKPEWSGPALGVPGDDADIAVVQAAGNGLQ